MSLREVINASLKAALSKSVGNNQWGKRHANAFCLPKAGEWGIVSFFWALADYADDYQDRFDGPVGNDGVLGESWLKIMREVRNLLNGDLGRLDGGTLDSLLFAMGREAGFTEEEMN